MPFGRKNKGIECLLWWISCRRVDVSCHKNCTGSNVTFVSKTVQELMCLMVEKL